MLVEGWPIPAAEKRHVARVLRPQRYFREVPSAGSSFRLGCRGGYVQTQRDSGNGRHQHKDSNRERFRSIRKGFREQLRHRYGQRHDNFAAEQDHGRQDQHQGRVPIPRSGAVTGVAFNVTLVAQPGDVVYATFTSLGDGGVDIAPFVSFDIDGILEELGSIKFIGAAGNDVGFGAVGDDDLKGGGGNDTLSGFAGADTVEGGAGADEMHGGTGKDTLSYKDSASKVTVNLNGTARGGDAEGDTFDGFENLTGSAFNDKLTGTNAANVLIGGDGNDQLKGANGADSLFGGTGTDTADYAGSSEGVIVDLDAGTGSNGAAEGDTLSSIENVKGSKFGDTLIGNIFVNKLNGAAGEDLLDGRTGNDILTGGAGDDTFVLSHVAASADTITDYTVGSDTLRISAAAFKGGLVAGQPLADIQLDINDTGTFTTNSTRFVLKTFEDQPAELYFDPNGAKDGGAGPRLIARIDGTSHCSPNPIS